MTDVVFLHAPEPEHPGGGADVRARALCREVGKQIPTELLVVGVDEDIEARSTLGGRIGAAVRGVPPRFSQRFDPRARDSILQRIVGARVVVAETLFVLPYLLGSQAKIVLDAHNVESEVVHRLARRHPSAVKRLAYRATGAWSRHWEESAAGRVLQIWAVSDAEARWFARRARDVIVVPNGVDATPGPTPLVRTPSLIFVGSMRAQFNRDGLDWFLENCWGKVRASVPRAVLHIVGEGSVDFAAEGVTAHGYVEDLASVYRQARVAIVPLLDGAGTRLKALEAMASGKPVVTTAIGVDGLAVRPGVDVLVADDATDFALACTHLLRNDDQADRIAAEAFSTAGLYDWSVIGRRAVESLHRLL